MNFSKRVIILNNVKSPEIAQAIFILRDKSVDDFSAVTEAERIVDEYLYCSPKPPFHGKKGLFIALGLVLSACGVLFFALR